MVTLVVLVSATALIAGSRLYAALAAYAAFTAATLWLGYDPRLDPPHLALFALIAALKLVAGPLAVALLARAHRVPSTLVPSLNTPWRIGVAVLVALTAFSIARLPALAGISQSGVVFYALFAAIATIVLHRNLLAHAIGLLALGSAVSLAGAVFAPGLPGSMELAGTFDALLATLVAVAVARAIVSHDPRLDVRSLRELRG